MGLVSHYPAALLSLVLRSLVLLEQRANRHDEGASQLVLVFEVALDLVMMYWLHCLEPRWLHTKLQSYKEKRRSVSPSLHALVDALYTHAALRH